MNPPCDTRVVSAEFEAGAAVVTALPDESSPEVAFVGKSNVGKSSLMNVLVARKSLVRTSSTPGCTRQLNLFGVRLGDGRELRLVDLPGYGYARLSKTERASWGEKLEAYVKTRAALACVVLVIDVRRGYEEDDAQMAEFVQAPRPAGPPPGLVVVATKLDKLEKSRRRLALLGVERAAGVPVVGFSAKEALGREPLWARVLAALPAIAPALARSDGVG
jgi:GTP-binding protein